MSKKTIVLGLFADRIDILLCAGGHVTASRRIPAALGTESAAWQKALKESTKPLRDAIQALGATGAPTTVIYRHTTACADYSSVALKSASQATQAAILGSAKSLSCALDEADCTAMVIGRDQSNGAESQTHLVIAADHDTTLDAIALMVESAGLKFHTAVPLDALIMARLGMRGLQSGGDIAGYLHVGEHRSFFILADHGTLLFARPINLGVDALSNSLTRPIRGPMGTAPLEMDLDAARLILHRHGFPKREDIIDAVQGLTGAQIIPLLQPTLQRFIVELRQSLRFGVAEEQRQNVTLTFTGPGSAIPNFATLLATELGLAVTTDESHAAFDFQQPDSCGSELMEALDDRKILTRLALQPKRISGARHIDRLRRCLWTGAAAALGLTGLDMMHTQQRLTAMRSEAATIQSQTNDFHSLQTTGKKLFAAIAAAHTLESAIKNELGERINIRANLLEISRLTAETTDAQGPIRLTHVSFNLDKGRMQGRLNGYAFEAPTNQGATAGASRTQLEPFIDKLKKSPLFHDVVLSNAQASTVSQMSGQQFEVNLACVGVPCTPCPNSISPTKPPMPQTIVENKRAAEISTAFTEGESQP